MNENRGAEALSLSTLGSKAIGVNSPANSHVRGHDAIPHAVGVIPPPEGDNPASESGDAAAGSNAMRSSLGVGASRSPMAPIRGRRGRFLGPGERLKAIRRGLLKREARLERSIAHRPDPWPRDLERWDAMRADIALFQKTLADLEAGRPVAASPLTGSKTVELPDAV